jgi:NAD(P)-dependent dehydrogenase (short-subunit alcohol dehydrogenase family)
MHALVIGNTDGIGLALTTRLLADGWTVTGISRRASELTSPHYTHVIADVTSANYRDVLAHSTAAVDVCVYCVGVGDPFDLDALARDPDVFRANLVGAVDTVAAVVPTMVAARRGHFIALSSLADAASSAAPAYSASKAGLSAYLSGLALALAPSGVRVTNIRFGFVDTKMAKSPVRPMMITADRAATVILRAIAKRPARVSFPRRMAWLVAILNVVTAVRLLMI